MIKRNKQMTKGFKMPKNHSKG